MTFGNEHICCKIVNSLHTVICTVYTYKTIKEKRRNQHVLLLYYQTFFCYLIVLNDYKRTYLLKFGKFTSRNLLRCVTLFCSYARKLDVKILDTNKRWDINLVNLLPAIYHGVSHYLAHTLVD